MSKSKKVVHIHPTDKNKWIFPEEWDVVLDDSVTQGEVKTWIYTPTKERKERWYLTIWKSILVFMEDYFTRKNDFKPK